MKNLLTTGLVVIFTLLFALGALADDTTEKGIDQIQQKYYKNVVSNHEVLVQAVSMLKLGIDNKNQSETDFYSRLAKNIISEDIRLTSTKATLDNSAETTNLLEAKKQLLKNISDEANNHLELRYRFMTRYIQVLNDEADSYRVKVASK